MLARWCQGVFVSAAALLACGGESRSHRDAPLADEPGAGDSAGTSGTGGGGSPLPTQKGVPVGDCVEPTPIQQLSKGCPVEQPGGTGCDVQGATCYYAIEPSEELMDAAQEYSVCLDGRWFPSSQLCSETCHSASADVETTRFDTSDCETRLGIACDPATLPDDQTSPPLNAQALMDEEFEVLLMSCGVLDAPGAAAELDFERGCVSELITSVSLDASVVGCVASKLSRVRYDCAVPLPCSHWFIPVV